MYLAQYHLSSNCIQKGTDPEASPIMVLTDFAIFSGVPPWPVPPALPRSPSSPNMEPSVSILGHSTHRHSNTISCAPTCLPPTSSTLPSLLATPHGVLPQLFRKCENAKSHSLSDESVLSGDATSKNITGLRLLGWRVLLSHQRSRAAISGVQSGPILLPVQKLLLQRQNASDSSLGWSTSPVTLPGGRRSPFALQLPWVVAARRRPSLLGAARERTDPLAKEQEMVIGGARDTQKKARKRMVMPKVVLRSVARDSHSPTRIASFQQKRSNYRKFWGETLLHNTYVSEPRESTQVLDTMCSQDKLYQIRRHKVVASSIKVHVHDTQLLNGTDHETTSPRSSSVEIHIPICGKSFRDASAASAI